MIMVLLNMLIALMGNTYNASNETYDKTRIKEKLRFILDKWEFRWICLDTDIEDQVYIIAAMKKDDSVDEDPIVQMAENQKEMMTL